MADTTAPGPSDTPTPLDPPAQAVQRAEAEAAGQQAYRNSAAGRDARLASRTAFRNQSTSEALSTTRRQFAGLVDTQPLKWPRLGPREELRGYLNDSAGVVTEASGRRGLVQSSLPLRGRTPGGARAPIDLALRDAGSGYAPASSAAAVRIPKQSDAELRFPEQSFGLSLAGARSQAATISSNKAFFANAIEDGDLVLEPQPLGAELSVVLRSPASPTSVPLRFNLATGQGLRLAEAGGDLPAGSAEVVDGAKRVAAIGPATTIDAQQQSVPVSYRVDGDRLTMEIDTSGDVAWPVLVDPPIGVYDIYGTSVQGWNPDGWTWTDWGRGVSPTTPATTFAPCNGGTATTMFFFCQGSFSGGYQTGGALYIRAGTTPSSAFTTNHFAQWMTIAPTDAYIYKFDATAVSQGTAGGKSKLYAGIWAWTEGYMQDPDVQKSGTVSWTGGGLPDGSSTGAAYYEDLDATPATLYIRARPGGATTFPAKPIPTANFAVFGMRMRGGNAASMPYVAMGGAATYTSETVAPDVDPPVHTNQPPTEWVESYSDSVSVTARDRGLGFGTLKVTGPGVPATATVSGCVPNDGPGSMTKNSYDKCVRTLSLSNVAYTAPEGANTYNANGTDLVGNRDTAKDQTWQAKVDNSAPVIGPLSGTLWNARGTQLGDGTYTLHADATDGSTANSSTQRSGVATIEVFVDDEQQDSAEQDCPAGSCPLSFDWTLDTADYTGGQHTVEVVATDQLGHVASAQSFTFSRPCCMSGVSIWGSFVAGSTDVGYGDVTGDSMADLIARNVVTGDVQVSAATGTSFAPPTSWGNWSPAYDLNVADVDGDGYADLVGRNGVTGDVSVSLSDGAAFGAAESWGLLATNYAISFADFDGDGTSDLVGTDAITRQVVVSLSEDDAFLTPLAYGNFDSGYQPRFVDADGDGAADLVEVDPSTGDVRVGISTDGDTFAAATSWGTYGTSAWLLFSDMNLDDQADVAAVDKTTGVVRVGYANGGGFDPLTTFGTWSPAYYPRLADIDGDGAGDVVGRNVLTGDVAGATTYGPIAKGSEPETYVPDPEVPWGDDVTDPDAELQAAAVKPGKRLGFEDARWFSSALVPENTSFPIQNHILDRMHDAGASVLRIKAIWGTIETVPAPGAPTYDFERLDKAVSLATQKHFQVLLTITGANEENDCTGPSAHFNHIGCAWAEPTDSAYCYTRRNNKPEKRASSTAYVAAGKQACFTDGYKRFVSAVVEHYTRSPDPSLRVNSFAIWNEPNLPSWLTVAGEKRSTSMYRKLYKAGYAAYADAIAATAAHPTAVSGTQIFIGEMSSRTVRGRTAPQYLVDVADGGSADPLIANGVAYHPYQPYPRPDSKPKDLPTDRDYPSKLKWTGIPVLGRLDYQIAQLCAKKPDPMDSSKKICGGGLRTPGTKPKAPPIFITEFGYFNQLRGDTKGFHTEKERKAWFKGDGKHQGALGRALVPPQNHMVHVKWFVLYHAVELPPTFDAQKHTWKVASWDSGLIGPPCNTGANACDTSACTNMACSYENQPNSYSDITGNRHYGKGKNGQMIFPGSGLSMKREAYCGIRRWAKNHHYPGATSYCP